LPDRTETERRRTVEEAVSYGVGSRVRIEILCILNEGTRSASELARLIHLPLTTISHHIREMANSKCIEVARVEKVRNADQHFYRAVELPFVSDEEAAKMSPEMFQEHAAMILQAITAEGLGSLWAGKMNKDPSLRMMWQWFNLDAQGRQELADEQRESWERLIEIEARATNRRAESGEKPVTHIAATMGFLRSRPVGSTAAAMQRLAPREN
jgi:DNA-binding transcriptional ArsR family regulator